MTDKRQVIGLTEKVILTGHEGKSREVTARIDTGATTSSIDSNLSAELSLGLVIDSQGKIKTKKIRSAHGRGVRPVVRVSIEIAGRHMKKKFTLADRKHMKYAVLIGQNVLKEGFFLIDPLK
jgi:hypothetical protein